MTDREVSRGDWNGWDGVSLLIVCLRYEYLWCDKELYRKPTKLPAPQYMARLMEWVEAQVNDEAIFPSAPGTPFPRNYTATVRKLLSRLFRVFVHVYIHHFDHLRDIGAVRCVTRTLKHSHSYSSRFFFISADRVPVSLYE